ncbi:MAG TPA: AAA family ATPase, partial [Candidatus Sulfotelmatobacter sp.]|nr:AAA family ATPase [Candidatus Sulfotelmatobacter sp.]
TRVVPTLPDKARKIVLGMVDVILFCDLEPATGADGKPAHRRVIRTKPHTHYEAGDRTGRLPEMIDLDFKKFVDAFAQGPVSTAPPPVAPTAPATNPTAQTKPRAAAGPTR